ncbi:hypothetical protein BOX15_Mlig001027g9, partial [Macrostomum lignano]
FLSPMLRRASAALLRQLHRAGRAASQQPPPRRMAHIGQNPIGLFPNFPSVKNPWVEDLQQLGEQKQQFGPARSVPVEFEASSEDFEAFVTPLLAADTVPEPPRHASYPTPSGWSPPSPDALAGRTGRPYAVLRTRNHMLPIYYAETDRRRTENVPGTRRMTIVKRIQGDTAALAHDLRRLLEPDNDGPLFVQVDDVSGTIRIVGQHEQRVAKFLMDCGF